MELISLQGVTPVKSPCLFSNPLDGSVIYPSANTVLISKDGKQIFLRDGDSDIYCMDMSPKGRMLAVAGKGMCSDIVVWDLRKNTKLFSFSEHDDQVECLSYSYDERMLVSIGDDSRILFWDMATGNMIAHHKLQRSYIVKFGPRVPDIKGRPTKTFYLASAGENGVYLHQFDPSNGSFNSTQLQAGKYQREITGFAFTEKYLLCSTESSDIMRFDLHSQVLLGLQQVGRNGISSIYQDDDHILAASGDGCVYDITNEPACVFQFNEPISSLANGYFLTSAGTIVKSPNTVIQNSHVAPVIAIDANTKFTVSISSDNMMKIWFTSNLQLRQSLNLMSRSTPSAVAISEYLLCVGFSDGSLRGYDLETLELLFTIDHCHHTSVNAIEISGNRRFFITGGEDSSLRIWDVRTRSIIGDMKETPISSLKLHSDSSIAFTASEMDSLSMWDLEKQQQIGRLTSFSSHVVDIDSHDNFIFAAEQDGYIQKFDPSTGNSPVAKSKVKEPSCLAVSADGSRLAVGNTYGFVFLIDAASLKVLSEIKVHSHMVSDIRFVGNNRVVSSGDDGAMALIKC